MCCRLWDACILMPVFLTLNCILSQDRVWFWSDGSSFDFSNWAVGEPNNWRGRREPCIMMNWGGKVY